ncbi:MULTISPECIES: P-loop NTPase family protein [Aeromonas]|uniref:hypothetical protein n=1 Tax=Aeromonas TaxID=642 RepID=UPI00083A40F4|nr:MULTISPECIES: hypothetical protein [Aeromonas]
MQNTSNSLIVYQAIKSFAKRMTQTRIEDGFLTARVIGEFSAGKTRLLTTLFGDGIEPSLHPVSSLEPQTRLQLEICYSNTPSLTLIEREDDVKPAVILEKLQVFPNRNETLKYDPFRHRLRLEVCERRLILESGDRFSDDTQPKRLFLIDTPGWNSGDDDLAESTPTELMTGYHNLALIYVVSAMRLDSAGNAERLHAFIEMLGDVDFLDRYKIMLVITHCPATEAEAMCARANDRLIQMWQSAGYAADELELDVLCIDFASLSDTAIQAFRQQFWHCLRRPLDADTTQAVESAHPWAMSVQHWPQEWQLPSRLHQSMQALINMRQLLGLACKDGDFMPGMNQHRMFGLDAAAMRRKAQDRWRQQLALTHGQSIPSFKAVAELPAEHPLFAWWHQYFLHNLQQALQPTEVFFEQADQALLGLTPEIDNLQTYLSEHLAQPWQRAQKALDSSFTRLLEQATQLDDVDTTTQLATMLMLSLIQTRYEDHSHIHRQQLLSEINA